MQNSKQVSKKKYAVPEVLFNLDGEHSYHTIHQKNDKEYAWIEGEDVLRSGKKKEEENAIDLEDEEINDEISAMTNDKDSPSKQAQNKSGSQSATIDIGDISMEGDVEESVGQTLSLTSNASC